MRYVVPTGKRLAIPTAKRLWVRDEQFMPSIRDGLLFVLPLRHDANAIYDAGVKGYIVPSNQSVDAVGTFKHPITGLITDAQANVLRIEKAGARLEGARTNVGRNTEDFTGWTKTNTTIPANQTASPDGITTADELKGDATVGAHYAQAASVGTIAGSTKYVHSVYAKQNGSKYLSILLGTGFTPGPLSYANFDLDAGTVTETNAEADGSGIESVGNGWYRCWIVDTSDASPAGTTPVFALSPDGIGDPLAESWNASADSVYIWGLQIEASAFPTSYIPATSGDVVRTADILEYASAGNLIGNGEWTIFLALTTLYDWNGPGGTKTVFDSNNAAFNNGMRLNVWSDGRWEYMVRRATGYSARIFATPSPTYVRGDLVVVALTGKTNEFKIYQDGVLLAEDLSGVLPEAHYQLSVGVGNTGAGQFDGNITHLMIYDRVLSATEITRLDSEINTWMAL